MHIGEGLDSLPLDLILEILSRLPAKSVLRFRSVSKLWGSLLIRPHFTDLFSTSSSARPRRLLLVMAREADELLLYSSPQPHEKSSLVVAADFVLKFPGVSYFEFCGYASGLIYFRTNFPSKRLRDGEHMICNPSTRQYARLPRVRSSGWFNNFIGFDPRDKIHKVLSMSGPSTYDHKILTLGSGTMEWRTIECHLKHDPSSHGICIGGGLYYKARTDETYYVIVCFDVRSETFTFIEDKWYFCCALSATLINHNGKLGLISWECDDDDAVGVLEDVEKQEWSKSLYSLKVKRSIARFVFVNGLTATGEIVFRLKSDDHLFNS